MVLIIPSVLADRLGRRYHDIVCLSNSRHIRRNAMRASLFFLSHRALSSVHGYHQLMHEVLLPCVQPDDSIDEALDDEVWALLCVLDAYVLCHLLEL